MQVEVENYDINVYGCIRIDSAEVILARFCLKFINVMSRPKFGLRPKSRPNFGLMFGLRPNCHNQVKLGPNFGLRPNFDLRLWF